MQFRGYSRINTKHLIKGMYVNTGMYYLQNNQYVLLCNHAVFTDEAITKIKATEESGRDIYMLEDMYEELLEQYDSFSQAEQVYKKEYVKLKNSFEKMLKRIQISNTVKRENVDYLVNDIKRATEERQLSFIVDLCSYLRNENDYSSSHSINVAMLNGMMAKWLNMNEKTQRELIAVGLLQDIGLYSNPEEGYSDETVKNIIMEHPRTSCKILRESNIQDSELLGGICNHHELANGTGYPRGIRMNDIPLYARITAITRIYDELIAGGEFQKAVTTLGVLENMYTQKYSILDIRLVDLFMDRMISQFIGRKVVLSDGRVTRIVNINPESFAYPLVCYKDELIQTTPDLCCETFCPEIEVAEEELYAVE